MPKGRGERQGTEPSGHAQVLRDFGLGSDDLASWEASGLSADAFEDWLTDHVARGPAGAWARKVYGTEQRMRARPAA